MAMIAPRLLVLWDIDHTLLASRGVGREMYVRAMPAAFGLPFVGLADVSGRTELDIIAETLELHEVKPTLSNIARLAKSLTDSYEAARGELAQRGQVLPGAREALTVLAAEPTVHQAVLTGNLKSVARIKLEVFDLAHFIDLESSAFGDDHADRSELVAIAQNRAAKSTGTIFKRVNTILIGDTPRDVEAAHSAGVKSIAVASGRSSEGELQAMGADHVLPSLLDIERLTQMILI
jgi:phosphoglycolate phosphatase